MERHVKLSFGLAVSALASMVLLASCGGRERNRLPKEAASMPEYVAEDYAEALSELEDLEYSYQHYKVDPSPEALSEVVEWLEGLSFEFDADELDHDNLATCRRLKLRIDSTKLAIRNLLDKDVVSMKRSLISLEDHLLSGTEEFPIYLQKGSMLYLDFASQGQVVVKLINADSRSVVKTYAAKKTISDSLQVTNSAIYLIELAPKGNVYVDVDVRQGNLSMDQFSSSKTIQTETVQANAGDFRATKVNGIQMQPVFEEPKKITLRSQGKAFFSGSSRSVVTVNVPKGAVDLLYSLRISTNEGDQASDGQFCKEMSETYKKVKFLGLPVYESQGNKSSLIRELLNNNVPPREEEAYCNMYVFTSQDQAKKFQDGTPAAELKYNVDLSTFGTQSCNGRIPVKGKSTIYLGFENERFRYSNYLWLEVISSVPHTEYYQNKYTLGDL